MRKHIIFLFVVAQFIAPLIFIGCSGCRDDAKIPVDIGHDHTLQFILLHEGGVTSDGLTYAGITQHTWESWREKQTDKAHLPKLVKHLAGDPRRNVFEDFHLRMSPLSSGSITTISTSGMHGISIQRCS